MHPPPRPSRIVPFVAAGALALAVVAILVIVLSTSSSGPAQPTYRQRVNVALVPVISANQSLSDALQALDGSKRTVVAAKRATTEASSALTSARAATVALNAPAADQTLSQQVAQALTQENGYLQALRRMRPAV